MKNIYLWVDNVVLYLPATEAATEEALNVLEHELVKWKQYQQQHDSVWALVRRSQHPQYRDFINFWIITLDIIFEWMMKRSRGQLTYRGPAVIHEGVGYRDTWDPTVEDKEVRYRDMWGPTAQDKWLWYRDTWGPTAQDKRVRYRDMWGPTSQDKWLCYRDIRAPTVEVKCVRYRDARDPVAEDEGVRYRVSPLSSMHGILLTILLLNSNSIGLIHLQVGEFERLFSELLQLEQRAKDPARLRNTRGGALLKEEKQRKKVQVVSIRMYMIS